MSGHYVVSDGNTRIFPSICNSFFFKWLQWHSKWVPSSTLLGHVTYINQYNSSQCIETKLSLWGLLYCCPENPDLWKSICYQVKITWSILPSPKSLRRAMDDQVLTYRTKYSQDWKMHHLKPVGSSPLWSWKFPDHEFKNCLPLS